MLEGQIRVSGPIADPYQWKCGSLISISKFINIVYEMKAFINLFIDDISF